MLGAGTRSSRPGGGSTGGGGGGGGGAGGYPSRKGFPLSAAASKGGGSIGIGGFGGTRSLGASGDSIHGGTRDCGCRAETPTIKRIKISILILLMITMGQQS
jgi:hypothetical protein